MNSLNITLLDPTKITINFSHDYSSIYSPYAQLKVYGDIYDNNNQLVCSMPAVNISYTNSTDTIQFLSSYSDWSSGVDGRYFLPDYNYTLRLSISNYSENMGVFDSYSTNFNISSNNATGVKFFASQAFDVNNFYQSNITSKDFTTSVMINENSRYEEVFTGQFNTSGQNPITGGYIFNNTGSIYTYELKEYNSSKFTIFGSINYAGFKAANTSSTNLATFIFNGNDYISGSNQNDNLNGFNGNDIINGGSGSDTAVYQGNQSQYTITKNNNGTWTIAHNNAGLDGTDTLTNVEKLQFLDTLYSLPTESIITGTSRNDNLVGKSGDDLINGLAGNDTLNGGAGNDTMVGGLGNDTYIVDSATDVVTEEIGAGTDTIQTTLATYTLASLTNVENLSFTGIGNSTLTGNTLNNVLTGNSGNNTLDGGLGNDTMIGGLGDDTYIVDSATDVVTEGSNAGIDTIQSSVTYTASNNIENLTLTGTSNINATGNSLNNTVTGNSGNNILNGGAGNDTMVGGDGDDLFIVGLTADHTATETINGGNGSADEIRFTSTTASTLTLSSNITNVEKITIGTGTTATAVTTATTALNINAANLTYGAHITGNNGNNILTGTLGYNDTLIGGLGNDTYVVNNAGDVVTEALNGGTDLVQLKIQGGSYILPDNVENLIYISETPNYIKPFIGGNTLNNILTGSSGYDDLWGSDGNDSLNGLAGNDFLSGGTGNDILSGGLGNDYLFGSSGNDTFIFNSTLSLTNIDTIEDFSHIDDTIQLSKSVMSALGRLGTLSANDFKFSTQTLDSSDRIIYNQTSGTLFYDADGSGRSAALQIAILDSRPAGIDYTDFTIIA